MHSAGNAAGDLSAENLKAKYGVADPQQQIDLRSDLERLDGGPVFDFTAPDCPLILAADLTGKMEVEHAIDRMIVAESVTTMYGPKDVFKSFVAIDLGMHIATKTPWNGREVDPGAFFYICGEGRYGIEKRMRAWCTRYEHKLEYLPVAFTRTPWQILDESRMQLLQEWLQAAIRRFGVKAGLIVIDTLSTNYGPGSQNDPSDMSRFIANIRSYLVGPLQVPAIVVHHTGKQADRGARGASPIEHDADQVLTLRRVDTDAGSLGLVELHCKHMKDGDRFQPMTFLPRIVELGDGNSSLILDVQTTERQSEVLEMLRRGMSQRDIAEAIGKTRNVARKEIDRLVNLGLWEGG